MRAYVFIMVTAYRLIAALVYMLRETGQNDPWEKSQKMLDSIARVERTEITLGKEHKIWYLNIGKDTADLLKKIGYGRLYDENNRVAQCNR